MSNKRSAAIIGLLCAATIAGATPWNNATTDGTVYVGPTGDYATVKQCADAFNALAGGINANWTILLTETAYDEPVNFGWGNPTGIAANKRVTMRPAPGVTATITFSAIVDNPGTIPSGNMFIGYPDLVTDSADTDVAIRGFDIDGCNTAGGSTRNLTITNTAPIAGSRLIVFRGAATDCEIRNCNLIQGSAATTSVYVINVHGRGSTARGARIPGNIRVNNCELNALSATDAYSVFGVRHDISVLTGYTMPTGNAYAIQNCSYTNNDVMSRVAGFEFNATGSYTVSGNHIQMDANGLDGNSLYAIRHITTQGATNWTGNIIGNTIDKMETGWTGANFASTAISEEILTAGSTVYIHNNMVTGFLLTSATGSATTRIAGIHAYGTGGTASVKHNSVFIAHQPNNTQLNYPSANFCLGCRALGANLDWQNNILVNDLTRGSCLQIGALPGTWTWTCNNNVLYALGSSTAYTGCSGTAAPGTTYASLANWQAWSGRDAGSSAQNPRTTTGSAWPAAPTTNLHFLPATTKPVGLLGVNPMAEVTTDIDGQTRAAINGQVYPGCDEIPGQPLPVSVSAFQID